MPAITPSGAIVLNTTRGGNEIILPDTAIYGREPFDTQSSPIQTALSEAQDACGSLCSVMRAHRTLLFLTYRGFDGLTQTGTDRRGMD
jgi:hypothetical protein